MPVNPAASSDLQGSACGLFQDDRADHNVSFWQLHASGLECLNKNSVKVTCWVGPPHKARIQANVLQTNKFFGIPRQVSIHKHPTQHSFSPTVYLTALAGSRAGRPGHAVCSVRPGRACIMSQLALFCLLECCLVPLRPRRAAPHPLTAGAASPGRAPRCSGGGCAPGPSGAHVAVTWQP
jgi:hypothetical protein